jgi:PAT family beta-lactamase induction signal transducer AmpG
VYQEIRTETLLVWMALAFTVPDALYVYLAYDMPDELWRITMILSVEQWCCGLGMAAFLYYIMYGKDATCPRAHLDACWSLSMLSIILTGLFTGAIQDYLGYRRFFVMVALLAIISLATLGWLVVKREKEKE